MEETVFPLGTTEPFHPLKAVLKMPRAGDFCLFCGVLIPSMGTNEHTKGEDSLNLRDSDHHAFSAQRPWVSRGKKVLD